MWPWRRNTERASSRRANTHTGNVSRTVNTGLGDIRKDAYKILVKASDDGDVVAVRAVLASGFVVKIDKRDTHSFYEYTPLHWAASKGHADIVDVLLCAGANPNATDKDRWTALHWAAWRGHGQVVDVMLRAGANLDAMDRSGATPLYNAPSNGHVHVVELLLQEAVERNDRRLNKHTALDVACRNNHKEVVNVLLVYGADLSATDRMGYTPMHRCIKSDQSIGDATLQTLQLLVSFGARWDATCDELCSKGEFCNEAPALRICIEAWAQELAQGRPFTCVPIDTIERGATSTQEYLNDRRAT